MKLGMLPRRSSSVCIFTAALVVRKCAQGKTDRHRSMVVGPAHRRCWRVPGPDPRRRRSGAPGDQTLAELGVNLPIRASLASARSSAAPARESLCGTASRLAPTDRSRCRAGPPSQLRESHHAELLGATECPHPSVATVALDDTGQGAPRQKSISWAKSVLPPFMATSSGHLRKVPVRAQIDTTPSFQKPFQTQQIRCQLRSVNRTAVRATIF